MRAIVGFVLLLFVGIGAAQVAQVAQPPAPAKDPPLIVVDTAGKEGEIQNWKIVAGIKRYVLQVEAKGEKPDPAKAGQDFVEFREDNSTDLKDGILTLVPLSSVRKLEYDAESKGVTLTAAVAEGKTAKLTGTTRFVNINKFFVEGSLDLGGDLGKATLKYQGGMSAVNPGVREFRLPFNQPVTQPTGTVYLLSGVDEDKSIHKIYDPKVLYRAGGADRVSGTLWFKETAKIPLTKIHTMSQPEEASEWQLKLIDGKQLPPLALVDSGFPEDGSAAQLVGILGKVAVGYKLFPMHTFTEMRKEGE